MHVLPQAEFDPAPICFFQAILDVIGNKILELPAQVMLAMANAQIVQTGCRFHETI